MMRKCSWTSLSGGLLAVCLLGVAQPFAAHAAEQEQVTLGQKVFYYFPNLVLDALDIFRVGIAVGPGIGGEIAFTEDAQLGSYVVNEQGIAWYGSSAGRKLVPHAGYYRTRVAGSDAKRVESSVDDASRFQRGEKASDEYDVRAEVALGLVHPYVGIDLYQILDLATGVVGYDLKGDNLQPFAYADGNPPRKLGRGVSNLFLGIWELPKSIYRVKQGHGSAAALTWGTAQGLQRFVVREVVGVYEILTFPTGSAAIVEPEFPFEPQVQDTEWRVRRGL